MTLIQYVYTMNAMECVTQLMERWRDEKGDCATNRANSSAETEDQGNTK